MLKNELLEGEDTSKKSDRTKRHLLEVSLKAFKKEGFDNCTMRDLAKEAGVTAPAFYYYFGSKEEIVAAFYEESLKEHLKEAGTVIKDGAPIIENLRQIILRRFEEFKDHRETLATFRRLGFDQSNSLSPFHRKHRQIRKESVDLFEQVIERSNLKWPPKTKRELAQVLWLFHLLILFYWIGDESVGQKKTRDFLNRCFGHFSKLLFVLKVPGAHRSLNQVFETLKFSGLMEEL
jgi:AcrR family transcriptional regulator